MNTTISINLDYQDPQILNKLELNDHLWELWKMHGPPPQRLFPDFHPTRVGDELALIKNTLRIRAKTTKEHIVSHERTAQDQTKTKREQIINLSTSGTITKEGMDLSLGQQAIAGGSGKPTIVPSLAEGEIDQAINPELMEPYFKVAGQAQPIRHDGKSEDGKEYWTPGLLVIDEIFRALLWTTYQKIKAHNDARQKPHWNTDAEYRSAATDLNDFVEAFSSPHRRPKKTDADNYRPFINYKEPGTYIKLLESRDKYIIGALVHVADWAGGSHSSGSGIP